jgi:hypothetical protein
MLTQSKAVTNVSKPLGCGSGRKPFGLGVIDCEAVAASDDDVVMRDRATPRRAASPLCPSGRGRVELGRGARGRSEATGTGPAAAAAGKGEGHGHYYGHLSAVCVTVCRCGVESMNRGVLEAALVLDDERKQQRVAPHFLRARAILLSKVERSQQAVAVIQIQRSPRLHHPRGSGRISHERAILCRAMAYARASS